MGIGTKPGCLTSFDIAGLATDLLPPDEMHTALSHVGDCGVCAEALCQATQDLDRELSAAENAAIAGYLKQRPAMPSPSRKERRTTWWPVAAAALLLLSAGTWFFAFPGDSAQELLAQASAAARPFESRLPAAPYGRAQAQRGEEANPPAALLRAQAELAKRAAAGERTVDLLRLQAWSELLSHQVGTAVRTLEEARRLAPNNLDVLSILGAAHAAGTEAGSEAGFSSAVELLTQVLQERPTDRAALYNRGLAYSRLGQPQAAAEDWVALLKVETDPAWAGEVRDLLAQVKPR